MYLYTARTLRFTMRRRLDGPQGRNFATVSPNGEAIISNTVVLYSLVRGFPLLRWRRIVVARSVALREHVGQPG